DRILHFCLDASLLLRGQHSVPTRRSSDLRHGREGYRGIGTASERDRFRPAGDEGSLSAPDRVQRAAPRRFILARWLHEGRNEDADRKSTRLNSSHLGISYAVFCLKKKMTL